MSALADRQRCDGCGDRASGLTIHHDAEGAIVAKCCPGCESLRKSKGLAPDDFEQYKLLEADQ